MEYSVKVIIENEDGKTLEYNKNLQSENGLSVNLEIIRFEDISGLLFNPSHRINLSNKIKKYTHSCLGGWFTDGETDGQKSE